MIHTEPAPAAPRRAFGAGPTRLTVYGCGRDEADRFRALAPGHNVVLNLVGVPADEATAELARGSRCVSVGHKTEVSDATLRALAAVGVTHVSTRSVGRDHIDVAFAASVGITVETVAYSPDGVADYTLLLLLMAVRGAKAMLRRTDAYDYRLAESRGQELRDLTVGVVGTGRIGRAVIERLRGFGCRVLAHDPGAATGTSLDELVDHSDVVTLHTPLHRGTHHLLGRERIGRLPRGAIVVNTGRGPLVDTAALLDALERGQLGGAALDVLEGEEGVFYADHGGEPPDCEALLRLQRLPNVLVTPHTAYYTERALRDTVEHTLHHCVRHA